MSMLSLKLPRRLGQLLSQKLLLHLKEDNSKLTDHCRIRDAAVMLSCIKNLSF